MSRDKGIAKLRTLLLAVGIEMESVRKRTESWDTLVDVTGKLTR